jgi:(S)-ureidoglycine aminohydrolase
MSIYHIPPGGLPAQIDLMTSRAVFTTSYAVLPAGTMRDTVTSTLPHWDKTRLWVLARPLSGFSETFSHYLVEVAPGGGSTTPEPDPQAEAVLFIVAGTPRLTMDGTSHDLAPGGYAFIPPGADWSLTNPGTDPASFHWVRKRYEAVAGIASPSAFVTSDQAITPDPMPDTDAWATTRFVERDDATHDMHVNIVTFQPGGVIPFEETHVMEHGLFVLQGKAVYKLNTDWVEVEAGDFMWLRAFCPQACYASGPGPFRYLLYKDVNRHAKLGSFQC